MGGRDRRRKGELGAAAVEMAIVLPLLVILLFGTVEFGLVFYNQQMLTNASREGARAGIVAGVPHVTVGEIQSVVNNYCATHLVSFSDTPATLVTTVTPDPSVTPPLFGDDLTVHVQYPYTFLLLPNFVSGLTGTLNLSAETVMRYE